MLLGKLICRFLDHAPEGLPSRKERFVDENGGVSTDRNNGTPGLKVVYRVCKVSQRCRRCGEELVWIEHEELSA